MREKNELNLAVLIDADNIPYSNTKGMLDEIAKLGVPTIKRIYGDWTKPTVYSYTTGKNATDSAMIIDAMDILHNEKVDGFCLVSSDSDFTRLATRLRESGMLVIGIGEKKTPNPFIVACDKFIYIEIIGAKEASAKSTTSKKQTIAQKKEKDKATKSLVNLIKSTIRDLSDDDDGWASLAEVGSLINKKKADFDPRNYGFQKLTPLIKSLNKYFIIDEREVEKSRIKHIYVKIR